jgi:hypothetical protein
MLNAAIGYYIHQRPVPDHDRAADDRGRRRATRRKRSRRCCATARRSRELAPEPKTRDSDNTILLKKFRTGGALSIVGANSARGFRRVSRKVVLFDETDGYPPSAGTEGDQIKLGIRRTEYYWDRKILYGSTPTTRASVASSGCSTPATSGVTTCRARTAGMQVLVFANFKWPKGQTASSRSITASIAAPRSNTGTSARWSRRRVASGPASAPFHGSFHGQQFSHLGGYSFSPNATWGQLCEEFVAAQRRRGASEDLRQHGARRDLAGPRRGAGVGALVPARETYPIGSCPAGRAVPHRRRRRAARPPVYEVVGWGRGKRPGRSTRGAPRRHVRRWQEKGAMEAARMRFLARSYRARAWRAAADRDAGVDSGYNTQTVYGWARQHPMNRVIAVAA